MTMPDDDRAKARENVCEWDIARTYRAATASFKRAYGCGPRACEVFAALCSEPRRMASTGELARRTALTPSVTSRAVGQLQERGLVRVVVDPRDKRRVVVSPTLHGVDGDADAASGGVLEAMRRVWDLRQRGATVEEACLCAALRELGVADVTELGFACGLPRSTVGFVLTRLEAAGRIERVGGGDARKRAYRLAED